MKTINANYETQELYRNALEDSEYALQTDELIDDIRNHATDAVNNNFGLVKKLTHKDFNWKNVDVGSNVIDLGDVKLEAEKTDDQKMEQAKKLLDQVGLKQAA